MIPSRPQLLSAPVRHTGLGALPDLSMRLASTMLLGVVLSLLWGPPASAQYIPDLGIVEGPAIPEEEVLDRVYDEARWRLGTLKIEPFVGLRDAAVVSNQDPERPEDGETDLTATVGAGLRLYAKPSAKVLVAAHALPDYVWWQDDSDRSRLNLNLGAGVFAHLNRLNFELSFRRTEEQRYFSSELPILQTTERDLSKAAVEVEVARGFTVYVVARDLDLASSEEDAQLFARVDRSEQRVALGLRVESRTGLWADLAWEESEVEFDPAARPLSNEGSTLGVGVGFEKSRLSGALRLGFRDLEPLGPGSLFTPLDDVTGSADLLWQVNDPLGFLVFARRTQTYALDLSQSYFLSDRYGLTVRLGLGRGFLQLTGALGEDDFESLTGPERVDDVQEASAQFSFPIRDLLVVSVAGSYIDYDSNLPGFDRDITSYGVNISLGRLAERLSLGRLDGDW